MMLRVIASLAFAMATTTSAHADCEQEATELRAHLDDESGRAKRWNTVWAILFGAAAIGQAAFAIAEVDPLGGDFDDDTRDTLWVGTGKATLAFGSKVILPLKIPVPARTSDACTDASTMRKALREAAKREKRSFWLTHLGGTAINLGAATYLTLQHSLKVGAISFAVSFPVGPASAYTQPRRSWKKLRQLEPTWTVGASTSADGGTLWVGGQW
jgi:hypothetical protein